MKGATEKCQPKGGIRPESCVNVGQLFLSVAQGLDPLPHDISCAVTANLFALLFVSFIPHR